MVKCFDMFSCGPRFGVAYIAQLIAILPFYHSHDYSKFFQTCILLVV